MKKIWLMACCLAQLCGRVWADDDDAPSAPPPKPPQAAVVVQPISLQWLNRDALAYGKVVGDARRVRDVTVARAVQVSSVRVQSGEFVHKGQALLETTNAPDTEQAAQQAQAALHYAQRERDRLAGLVQARLATAAQLSAADKAVSDAKAVWQAQQDAGADHAVTLLRAPCDGFVTLVDVTTGDRVSAGSRLLQLSPLQAERVSLQVEARDAVQVRPGMAVQLVSVLRPEVSATGSVVGMMSVLTDGALAVQVQVSSGLFLPGEAVRGRIHLARMWGDVVPRSAVLPGDSGFYVYQVRAAHAVQVPVKVRLEQGSLTLVQGALAAGLPVVISGNYELQPGMAVRETVALPIAVQDGTE